MSEPRGFFERKPLRKALFNWLERHQHPFNRGIHFVGIPLVLASVILFFVLPWEQWYWSAAAFVAGYLLQWIGHLIEGNDVGEWAGIKRLLGLPYVAISPRYQKPADDANSPVYETRKN
ncbi:MAG: DUF962 domain-containing protein [Planctomycetes bacterium]|jgi:hypothetical protein|nr:DUF962 domain-containing protein [Planctomycetota bacterium]